MLDTTLNISRGFFTGHTLHSIHTYEPYSRSCGSFWETMLLQHLQVDSALNLSDAALASAKLTPLNPHVKRVLLFTGPVLSLLSQVEWGNTYKRKIVLALHDHIGMIATTVSLVSHVALIALGRNRAFAITSLSIFTLHTLFNETIGKPLTITSSIISNTLGLAYSDLIFKFVSLHALYSTFSSLAPKSAKPTLNQEIEWKEVPANVAWHDIKLSYGMIAKLPEDIFPEDELSSTVLKSLLIGKVNAPFPFQFPIEECIKHNNRWRLRESSLEKGAALTFANDEIDALMQSYDDETMPRSIRPYFEAVATKANDLDNDTFAKIFLTGTSWPDERVNLLRKTYYTQMQVPDNEAIRALYEVKEIFFDSIAHELEDISILPQNFKEIFLAYMTKKRLPSICDQFPIDHLIPEHYMSLIAQRLYQFGCYNLPAQEEERKGA